MDASNNNAFDSFTNGEASGDGSKLVIDHSSKPSEGAVSEPAPKLAPPVAQTTEPVNQPIENQPQNISSPPQRPEQPITNQPTLPEQPVIPLVAPMTQPTEPTISDELYSMQDDIILAEDQPKSNKKKLIILGTCAGVIIIGLIVAGIIISNIQKQAEALKSNWNTYYSLLLYGPDGKKDDKEITVTNWYPEVMSNNNSAKEYDDYYNSLHSAYTAFINSAHKTKTDLGDYEPYSKVFFEYNTTSTIESTILDLYLDSGTEAATTYINTLGSDLDSLAQITSQLKPYFSTKLELMEKYNSYNCYTAADTLSCKRNIANTHDDVASLISTNSYYYWNMVYYYNHGFSKNYLNQTNTLNSKIGG